MVNLMECIYEDDEMAMNAALSVVISLNSLLIDFIDGIDIKTDKD